MEETKTPLEVYQKFQKAVDLIEEKFFTGKRKQSFPRYVLAINTKCKSVVCAFVQNNALFDKSNGDYFNVVEYSQTVAQGYKDKNPNSDVDLSDAPTADNADKPIKVYNRNKIKYECACGKSLWGKGNLYIICGD